MNLHSKTTRVSGWLAVLLCLVAVHATTTNAQYSEPGNQPYSSPSMGLGAPNPRGATKKDPDSSTTRTAEVSDDNLDPTSRPEVRASPTEKALINIDGVLSEPVWDNAERIDRFVERSPRWGEKPRAKTEIRVLYDTDYLYVASTMWLIPGEQPKADELTRDSFAIFRDDMIGVAFDGRHDARSNVFFAVNPANAQFEWVTINNGERSYREFDAIWYSATKVYNDRWVAEMRIPFHAIGVPAKKGEQTIGFQILRLHASATFFAAYDFSLTPKGYDPASPSIYGTLRGIKDVSSGTVVSVMPYVLVGAPDRDLNFPAKFRAGGDIRARIGEETWAQLSIITDYNSGFELDDAVVNLTRFPLFLPERRQFYLTGLDVFDETRSDTWSHKTLWFGSPEDTRPFYSRRIGLDDQGRPTLTYGGVKVYGRSGKFRYGILDMLTANPTTNSTVIRNVVDITKESQLGVLVTAKDTAAGGSYTLGVDGNTRAVKNNLRASFAAETVANRGLAPPLPSGPTAPVVEPGPGVSSEFLNRSQLTLAGAWMAEPLTPSTSFTWIGRDYNPALGLVQRSNVGVGRLAIPYTLRNLGSLAELRFESTGQIVTSADLQKRLGSTAGLGTRLDFNTYNFLLQGTWLEDKVRNDFELYAGKTVAAGTYSGPAIYMEANRGDGFNPFGGVSYLYSNSYYGGSLHQVGGWVDAAFTRHVRLRVRATPSMAIFPGEIKRFITVQSSVVVAASTSVWADVSVRGNSLEQNYASLARIRWRFLPGSEASLQYRFDRFNNLNEHEVFLKILYWKDILL